MDPGGSAGVRGRSRGRSAGRGGSAGVRAISVGVIGRSSARGRSAVRGRSAGARGRGRSIVRRAKSVTRRAKSVGAAAKSDGAQSEGGPDKGSRCKSLDRGILSGDCDLVPVLGSPNLTVRRLRQSAGPGDVLYSSLPNQNSWIDVLPGQISIDVWGAAGDNAAGNNDPGNNAAGDNDHSDNAAGDNDHSDNAAGDNAEKWNEELCSGNMFNF